MMQNEEYKEACKDLDRAYQYFNYAIEEKHIDRAIKNISICEKKLEELR